MASTTCLGKVFALFVIIPVNFISFTSLRVVSRDFLKTRSTKYAQTQFFCKCSVQNGEICLFLTFLTDFNEFRQVDLRMGSIYYFSVQ